VVGHGLRVRVDEFGVADVAIAAVMPEPVAVVVAEV